MPASNNAMPPHFRYDLSFNLVGYVMVFISDFATASNGVYTMKKLQNKVNSQLSHSVPNQFNCNVGCVLLQSLGKYGILFYNALFMLLPAVIFTMITGGFYQVCLTNR